VANLVFLLTASAKQHIREAIDRGTQECLFPALCRTTGLQAKEMSGDVFLAYRGIIFGIARYDTIHPGFAWYTIASRKVLIHALDLAFLYGKVIDLVAITNPVNGREIDALVCRHSA